MDAVVDRYFPLVDALEADLEEVESQIFLQGAARWNIERLYALKHRSSLLRHAVVPLLEVVGKLHGGRVPAVCMSSQEYFRDVHDHLARINSAIDAIRDTIATAIRIGNPASYELALSARECSLGMFGSVTDAEILWMHRFLSQEVGVFVEPSSATGAAGLLKQARAGEVPADSVIVVTVTGHGLKDPMWALKTESGEEIVPTIVPNNAAEVAERLGLA